ncbi:uncharacterized protein LOC110420588 [Herrania umbratica]|uniref:Uncharacterized protein LOC110420588 n=1 Tax=Herrania umbratica TaxID=108875 RepID=A0A6J1AQZ7_9ROSI|nr:uncharacterized protein LOC110420588 [Herrania umbratica]
MADNLSLCLVVAMDRLWFHQIILFPEPFSLYFPKTLRPVQQPNSESTTTSTSPSSSLSLSSLPGDIPTAVSPLPDQENSAISSPLTPPDDSKREEEAKKRPTRVSLSRSRSRSHSSSPSTQKRQRNHRHSTSCSPGGKLQESMSCRSLKDLELEEVKGFMDLGFIFKKENLNARMISVVPGLLRLGFLKTKQKTELNLAADELPKDDDIEPEETGVVRPYLSEAWLIKRPDSPLLNLRVPRVYAAADMKKHLKFWARTVASVVQQEC